MDAENRFFKGYLQDELENQQIKTNTQQCIGITVQATHGI